MCLLGAMRFPYSDIRTEKRKRKRKRKGKGTTSYDIPH
jgi:hypothetical protein